MLRGLPTTSGECLQHLWITMLLLGMGGEGKISIANHPSQILEWSAMVQHCLCIMLVSFKVVMAILIVILYCLCE